MQRPLYATVYTFFNINNTQVYCKEAPACESILAVTEGEDIRDAPPSTYTHAWLYVLTLVMPTSLLISFVVACYDVLKLQRKPVVCRGQ